MDFKEYQKNVDHYRDNKLLHLSKLFWKEKDKLFFLQSNFSSFSLKDMTFDRINKIAQQSSKPHFSHWSM